MYRRKSKSNREKSGGAKVRLRRGPRCWGGGVDKFNIDKSLIHSFRNAHSLYKDEMKTQKNAAEREDEIRFQNKRKQSEIHELEAKREKMLAEASKISAEIEDLKK
ncbi:hypothetical protein R5R35_001244 [Gryllus longicercus]|uniref:Uncharacterized protein n=1 Tax=Gryllus longicercus TaxID=2509291 RepID=A0AAN9YW97_9ORTH